MVEFSRILAPALALFVVSCAEPPPPKAPKPPPPQEDMVRVPDGAVDRGSLEVVLRQGPPWLLSLVPVENVMAGKTLDGWRVQELPLEWRGIELQAGDVVTAVNAMPLETPTEMFAAWTTLSVASEIKIAYLRDGEPQEMSIPIYGNPSPTLASDMQKRPERPPADQPQEESPVRSNAGEQYAPVQPKKTITIESNDRPFSETNTDWSDHPF